MANRSTIRNEQRQNMDKDPSIRCAGCDAPIQGEPPIPDDPAQRAPCPHCGSTIRNISLPASSAHFSLVGGSATLTITLYSETLLDKARELIAMGDFNIEVVVAHMACEISSERAISRAFAEKGIEYLEESVSAFLPGYNLANPRIREFYNAVTGNRIQDQFFWPAFKISAVRRNGAVHRGSRVTKAEAEESHQAASNLVAYLKDSR
jgi:hypothetical protein